MLDSSFSLFPTVCTRLLGRFILAQIPCAGERNSLPPTRLHSMKFYPRGAFQAAAGVALFVALAGAARAQLAAEEELKTLKATAPFEVSLFAAEPMITNPSAIDVDTHGRVWVAEIQWYRGGAKNPPADKIKVLEDTDGDGKADKVTVFAEGVFCPDEHLRGRRQSICRHQPRPVGL